MTAFLPSRSASVRELHTVILTAHGARRCTVSGEAAPCTLSQRASDAHAYMLDERTGLCRVCRGAQTSGAHHRTTNRR